MALPLEESDRPFTYGDCLTWSGDERWEIIDGVPVAMSPAPDRRHQGISANLFHALRSALPPETRCRLYYAPFDVRLPETNEADEDVTTVVQPDLVLVCDPAKLDDRGCRGAPDLIVEILSPSSARRDLQIKRDLYERHGVREYWIVQPMERIVIVYRLSEGRFDRGAVYTERDTPNLHVLPDVQIRLNEVFAE